MSNRIFTMRYRRIVRQLVVVLVTLIVILSKILFDGYAPTDVDEFEYNDTVLDENVTDPVAMHLAVSVCGDRLEESLVMMKSVALFTTAPFHAHVFISNELRETAAAKLLSLRRETKKDMKYTLYSIQFPKGLDAKVWTNLFRPCASQRLFIPEILNEVDALVYADTDVIFLRSLEDIWKNFAKFDKAQIVAMATETELPPSWYTVHQDTPSVPPYGVNSGVFLMNATRIRQLFWLQNMTAILAKYRNVIRLGDQDILNIYFHNYPEQLYGLTCDWNYRPDRCKLPTNCNATESNGIGLLHGNGMVFHRKEIFLLNQLYQSILNHKFGEDIEQNFNNSVTENLMKASLGRCSNATAFLFNQLLWNFSQIPKFPDAPIK